MRVKVYRGENTKSALDCVKAELGLDAVILSTKKVEEDGKTFCEVTVGIDENAEIKPVPTFKDLIQQQLAQADAGDGSGRPEPQKIAELLSRKMEDHTAKATDFLPKEEEQAPVSGWGQWQDEWRDIKENLLGLMKSQLDYSSLAERHAKALRYLEKEGVKPDVLMSLYRELRVDPQIDVLTLLEKQVKVKAWSPSRWPQKFHALAGPHGAGKTTTLIRLGLLMKRCKPDMRILIVNTDTTRSNGRHLLRNYSELSQMRYAEVSNDLEFQDVIDKAGEFDKVIIDLPGLPKTTTLEKYSEKMGFDEAPDLRFHLVFSPYYSAEQMNLFERQYFSPKAAGLIWTKLDEAYNYGTIINAAADTGLPTVALSYGSALKDTLAPAVHLMLWKLIFKHRLPVDVCIEN